MFNNDEWWRLLIKKWQVRHLSPEQREDLYNELVVVENQLSQILKKYDIY